jgi:hypothetical protein
MRPNFQSSRRTLLRPLSVNMRRQAWAVEHAAEAGSAISWAIDPAGTERRLSRTINFALPRLTEEFSGVRPSRGSKLQLQSKLAKVLQLLGPNCRNCRYIVGNKHGFAHRQRFGRDSFVSRSNRKELRANEPHCDTQNSATEGRRQGNHVGSFPKRKPSNRALSHGWKRGKTIGLSCRVLPRGETSADYRNRCSMAAYAPVAQ